MSKSRTVDKSGELKVRDEHKRSCGPCPWNQTQNLVSCCSLPRCSLLGEYDRED